MDGKSLEFGSLGAGRGAPFAVPLLLGILAVTAVLLLLVDPPGLGEWLMFAVMAADQVRETFQVVLEGATPLLVQSCGRWRNPDDNRLEAEAAAREIAAATGLAARREGYRVTERAVGGGVAREVRQDASAATPLD